MSKNKAGSTQRAKVDVKKEVVEAAIEGVTGEQISENGKRAIRMAINVIHDNVEYKIGDKVPDKFSKLFLNKGFAKAVE